MISNGWCAASATWISRASGWTLSASLQTGMTTESFMARAQYTAAMSDHHGHDHHEHGSSSSTLLGAALALTGAFMLVEFAGGILARSLALLADAGHMLTDTAALALAWAATRIASRPADRLRSFGYQRLRVLATFVNGCALLFIVAWIAIEAVQRLLAPVAVNATAILWVGGLGLVVNLIVF